MTENTNDKQQKQQKKTNASQKYQHEIYNTL